MGGHNFCALRIRCHCPTYVHAAGCVALGTITFSRGQSDEFSIEYRSVETWTGAGKSKVDSRETISSGTLSGDGHENVYSAFSYTLAATTSVSTDGESSSSDYRAGVFLGGSYAFGSVVHDEHAEDAGESLYTTLYEYEATQTRTNDRSGLSASGANGTFKGIAASGHATSLQLADWASDFTLHETGSFGNGSFALGCMVLDAAFTWNLAHSDERQESAQDGGDYELGTDFSGEGSDSGWWNLHEEGTYSNGSWNLGTFVEQSSRVTAYGETQDRWTETGAGQGATSLGDGSSASTFNLYRFGSYSNGSWSFASLTLEYSAHVEQSANESGSNDEFSAYERNDAYEYDYALDVVGSGSVGTYTETALETTSRTFDGTYTGGGTISDSSLITLGFTNSGTVNLASGELAFASVQIAEGAFPTLPPIIEGFDFSSSGGAPSAPSFGGGMDGPSAGGGGGVGGSSGGDDGGGEQGGGPKGPGGGGDGGGKGPEGGGSRGPQDGGAVSAKPVTEQVPAVGGGNFAALAGAARGDKRASTWVAAWLSDAESAIRILEEENRETAELASWIATARKWLQYISENSDRDGDIGGSTFAQLKAWLENTSFTVGRILQEQQAKSQEAADKQSRDRELERLFAESERRHKARLFLEISENSPNRHLVAPINQPDAFDWITPQVRADAESLLREDAQLSQRGHPQPEWHAVEPNVARMWERERELLNKLADPRLSNEARLFAEYDLAAIRGELHPWGVGDWLLALPNAAINSAGMFASQKMLPSRDFVPTITGRSEITAGQFGSGRITFNGQSPGSVVAPVQRAAAQARGGTYILRDPATGRVMRTGRTNDLARRQLEHARDPALRDFEFEVAHRTDVYAEQRGLEQLLHETHTPPLNRIGGIDPRNPRLREFREAARRFLKGQQGGP